MEELTQDDKDFIDQLLSKEGSRTNAYVNGNVNGSHNLEVNNDQNESKTYLIAELKRYNYLTPARIVADSLEKLFAKWPSKDGHWLYVAQHYTPKTINSVLDYMVKRYKRDGFWPKSPPSYFTNTIQHRPLRKIFRNIRRDKNKRRENVTG